MTQTQLHMQNLHNQLEQRTNNTDLQTQPLFTDSPVLFPKPWNKSLPMPFAISDQTSSQHNNSKQERIAPQIPSKNNKYLQKYIKMNNLNNLMEHLYLRKNDMK